MPWIIRKRNGKFCVYKEGADGEPTGDVLGTHETEDEARQQQAALYASERKAVKFTDGADDTVEGTGMPFGGPFAGQDLDGEHFSAKTDFAFDWFGPGARPAVYHHGLDDDAGLTVVGRVKSWDTKPDLGVWAQVQLDKQGRYFQAISDLVKAGKLYFSSGAMSHLVKKDTRTGEITRWPWVELSLTPTPANLLATVDMATADKHFKAAGLEISDEVKAKLDQAALDALPDSDFAYIDSTGGRHLPMNDAEHARNALARFDQTTFESDEAKAKARRRLMARCDELGIQASKESKSIKAISYEDIRYEVAALIDKRIKIGASEGEGPWAHVECTFPDYVIACIRGKGIEHYYAIPYVLALDGHVASIGEASEVEEVYVPVAKTFDPNSLSVVGHAIMTADYAARLAERTKDLRERRIKEGRVISTANRTRLAECLASMQTAVVDLQALLDSTEPQTAKAASVRRLHATLVAQHMASLTLN